MLSKQGVSHLLCELVEKAVFRDLGNDYGAVMRLKCYNMSELTDKIADYIINQGIKDNIMLLSFYMVVPKLILTNIFTEIGIGTVMEYYEKNIKHFLNIEDIIYDSIPFTKIE